MTRLSRFLSSTKRSSLWGGRGLAIAFALAVQSGCLIPQSIDAIAQAPHPTPHIVLESVPTELLVPVVTLYRQGASDATATPPCHCELEIYDLQVEEDDPTVSLEARWFIDYETTVPSSELIRQTEPLAGSFTTDSTTRALRSFDFDPDIVPIYTSGVHVVEVVVGETAGFDPDSTTLPNRAMLPGYEAAQYRFVIQLNVAQDPAEPSCPNQLPSQRICQ